jgi:hypothetical protein
MPAESMAQARRVAAQIINRELIFFMRPSRKPFHYLDLRLPARVLATFFLMQVDILQSLSKNCANLITRNAATPGQRDPVGPTTLSRR